MRPRNVFSSALEFGILNGLNKILSTYSVARARVGFNTLLSKGN